MISVAQQLQAGERPGHSADAQANAPAMSPTHGDAEAVRLRRRIVQLETEVLQLRQDLARERRHANVDALTGIPNRRAYERRLQEDRVRSQRENKRLALIVWDIDRFKAINDRYGHAIGDQILVCVARRISRRLRKSDFVARCGGEEFVAILSDCDAASARQLAEQLREAISLCAIETQRGDVSVTVSCGIAELLPGEQSEALFARADRALYGAKAMGRNRVCVAGA